MSQKPHAAKGTMRKDVEDQQALKRGRGAEKNVSKMRMKTRR